MIVDGNDEELLTIVREDSKRLEGKEYGKTFSLKVTCLDTYVLPTVDKHMYPLCFVLRSRNRKIDDWKSNFLLL